MLHICYEYCTDPGNSDPSDPANMDSLYYYLDGLFRFFENVVQNHALPENAVEEYFYDAFCAKITERVLAEPDVERANYSLSLRVIESVPKILMLVDHELAAEAQCRGFEQNS